MFIHENGTKIVPYDVLDNCKQYGNSTICKLIEKIEPKNGTNCITNIVQNKTEYCHTKNITNQNYLIELSEHHIFWYIVEPITLHISCEDEDMTYDLTKSTHIYLNESCDEFYATNEKPETIRKTIQVKENELSANFSKYDEIYGNWTLNETLKIDKINFTSLEGRQKNEGADEQYHSKTYRFFNDIILVPIEYAADVEDPILEIFLIIIIPITLWICFLRVCCKSCLE